MGNFLTIIMTVVNPNYLPAIICILLFPCIIYFVFYMAQKGNWIDLLGISSAIIFGILFFILGSWGVIANQELFVSVAIEGGIFLLAGVSALTPEFHRK